tara:strand:- start:60733 stop:61152 length:420 start_codon:yes stop_codon:yes gene_type:complete
MGKFVALNLAIGSQYLVVHLTRNRIETIGRLGIATRRANFEGQWQRRTIAKSDIDKEGLAFAPHPKCHVIELGSQAAFAHHSRREKFNRKADLAQQPSKEPIELIAKTTSSPSDDFSIEARRVEAYLHTKVNVKVLERN